MSEERKIIILVLIVTFAAVAGYLFLNFLQYQGDLVVENYTVELSPDGTLQETIEYNVKTSGKYRMLYVYWNDIVTYNQTISEPHLNVLDVDSPYISYVKDYYNHVHSSGL